MRSVYFRPLIGLLLIAVSAGGMFWWEKEGREQIMSERVVVALRDIEQGEEVKINDLAEVPVLSESIVKGAVRNRGKIDKENFVALQYIPANSQITEKMFGKKDEILEDGKSIFEIKPEWVFSMSSSIRKGDRIAIYDESGLIEFGEFTVAFVKDQNQQEVVNPEGSAHPEDFLDRLNSTAPVSHIEIIASLEEYLVIKNEAEMSGVKILIVQRSN